MAAMAGESGMASMDADRGAGEMGEGHEGMAMKELSTGVQVAWIGGTFLVLLAALWLTAQWVPITFNR